MWLSAHRQPENPCHQCWIIDPVLIWGINYFSRIIGTSPLVQRREWACCSAQSCTHWRLWIQAPAFTLAWILFDMDTDRNQIRHLKTFLSGDQCFSVKRAIKSGLSALLLSPSWLSLTTSSLLHTSVDENKVALIQSYTKKKKKRFPYRWPWPYIHYIWFYYVPDICFQWTTWYNTAQSEDRAEAWWRSSCHAAEAVLLSQHV